jgi:hypothetical protein
VATYTDFVFDSAVHAALVEFRNSPIGQQLFDPAQANGRCKPAALALLALLRERGYEHSRLRNYIRPGEQHYVVELDGTIIDPTARQFAENATAEVPKVVPLEEFEAAWDPHSLVVNFEDVYALRFIHKLPNQLPEWRSARDSLPVREPGF